MIGLDVCFRQNKLRELRYTFTQLLSIEPVNNVIVPFIVLDLKWKYHIINNLAVTTNKSSQSKPWAQQNQGF